MESRVAVEWATAESLDRAPLQAVVSIGHLPRVAPQDLGPAALTGHLAKDRPSVGGAHCPHGLLRRGAVSGPPRVSPLLDPRAGHLACHTRAELVAIERPCTAP